MPSCFFFVVGHLLGNLQIFLGADWLNAYAKHLMEWPLLLWPMRVILAICLVAHMTMGVRLAIENKAARPVPYGAKATVRASLASRTMLFSGLAISFFILFHLAHFTLGKIHPEHFHLTDALGRHDVYSMVILSFRHVWTSFFYILAVFFLSLHLSHGASSIFQSLGLMSEKCRPLADRVAAVLSIFLFIGYASIPLASWFGWIRPLGGA